MISIHILIEAIVFVIRNALYWRHKSSLRNLKVLTLLIFFLTPMSAHADWFYRLVGFQCDHASDNLIIYYKGAYNEAGKAMLKNRSSTEWAPAGLVVSMKDDDHIGELLTIKRTCKLRHATYHLRIGPTPGNYNVQGRCGAVITAWVEVRQGNKIILPRYEFEGACYDTESPITTEIVFSAKSGRPKFEKVSPADFLK